MNMENAKVAVVDILPSVPYFIGMCVTGWALWCIFHLWLERREARRRMISRGPDPMTNRTKGDWHDKY